MRYGRYMRHFDAEGVLYLAGRRHNRINMAGMKFFSEVARLAEEDEHHPDLHLTGYRNVWIELSTHAIGGLSENDFILAAKIDQLPVETKK